jgi:hypothetical protein
VCKSVDVTSWVALAFAALAGTGSVVRCYQNFLMYKLHKRVHFQSSTAVGSRNSAQGVPHLNPSTLRTRAELPHSPTPMP